MNPDKLAFTVLLLAFSLISCRENNDSLDTILTFENKKFQEMVLDKSYEFQMIFTEIERTDEKIKFKSHRYNIDSTLYFYPASTVKLPIAILSLQKLNAINRKKNFGLTQNDHLLIDSIRPPQTEAYIDSTTVTGKPTFEQYINKIFAVSDNDAYNRLLEFLGTDYINNHLEHMGCFSNSRIRHRVGAPEFDSESNRFYNPFSIAVGDSIVYSEDEKISKRVQYPALSKTLKGKGFYKKDSLINSPFDFSKKNFVSLPDYEKILKRLFFPKNFHLNEQFDLEEEQYEFLKSTMARTPRQHSSLELDTLEHYDSYVKFFLFGDKRDNIPDHIKIYNKVGYAYGYLTDIAYIEDSKHNIDFFLLATIHVNKNQIYNDNKYEYEELGIPFLATLGRNAYDYLLTKNNTSQ